MTTVIQWLLIVAIIWFILQRFLPVKGIANISIQEVNNKLKNKKVQFIDVRTPGEYKANHRPPFKNMPLAILPQQSKELDKQREVVVICQSGMRSMRAAKLLKKQGFDHVTNVKGGMGAWR